MLRVLYAINGLCIGVGWTEALVAENTSNPGDKVMVGTFDWGTRNNEESPWGSAREDLAEARCLIDKHGYHRRDGELAER